MNSPAPLLTLRLEVDNEATAIDYPTLDSFLCDEGLRALFEDGHVSECSVYCGEKRITGLPVMDWQRLRDHVIANSATILRSKED